MNFMNQLSNLKSFKQVNYSAHDISSVNIIS